MTQSEVSAVVVMSDGSKIESAETLANLLERFTRARDKVMSVTDTGGREHHVNVNHVVEVREPLG